MLEFPRQMSENPESTEIALIASPPTQPMRVRLNGTPLELDTAQMERAITQFVETMLATTEQQMRDNSKIGLMVQAMKAGLHLGLPILRMLMIAGTQDAQMVHDLPIVRFIPPVPELPRHA